MLYTAKQYIKLFNSFIFNSFWEGLFGGGNSDKDTPKDDSNKIDKLNENLEKNKADIIDNTKKETEIIKKEVLSQEGNSVIGFITPSNSISDDDSHFKNDSIKTTELGGAYQFNLAVRESIKTDEQLLGFFNEIPQFSDVKNIKELNIELRKLGKQKVILILEQYIEPEIGITTLILFNKGPKATLKERVTKIEDLRDKRELVKAEILKEVESYKVTNNFYEGPIVNGKHVLIHVNAMHAFADRIADDIVIKNRGNLTVSATNLDGLTGISTGIGVNELFNKLGIKKGEVLTSYFKKFGSTLTLNIGKDNKIGFILYNGNLVSIPVSEETKIDLNGSISNYGVSLEGDLNTEVGEFTSAGVGVGASVSFDGGFVVGPYIKLGKDVTGKMNELRKNVEEVFLGDLLTSIKEGKSYDKDNFTLKGKIDFTEVEYKNLKEIYDTIGTDYSEDQNEQNRLFEMFLKDQVIEEVVDEYEGFNFSGARVSIVDPHMALVSFITTLAGGVKIIGRGTEKTSLESINSQAESTKETDGFDSEVLFRNGLTQLGIEFKDNKMIVPEAWEVYGDDSVQIIDGWFSKPVIGGDINDIKLIKIIGEDVVSDDGMGEKIIEPKITYRLVLNNATSELKEAKSKKDVKDINFIKAKKPEIAVPVVAVVPVVAEISGEESKDINFNTLENVKYKELQEQIDNKEITVRTFRDNPEYEELWITLSQWEIEDESKYSDQIMVITGINFSELGVDQKSFVVDYLASMSSRFDNTEVKIGKLDTSGLLDGNNIIIEGVPELLVKFKKGAKFPFIYDGNGYGYSHLIQTLNKLDGVDINGEAFEKFKKLHNYNISIKEFDEETFKIADKKFTTSREEVFNDIGGNDLGLKNYSSLHDGLVKSFKGENNNLKSEFMPGVIGFTFKSSLKNDGERVYKGLGKFSKGVHVVSIDGNWKNQSVHIIDNNHKLSIVDKFDARQIEELSVGLELDGTDDEIVDHIKELISKNDKFLDMYLVKDIGLDDTIIIDIKGNYKVAGGGIAAGIAGIGGGLPTGLDSDSADSSDNSSETPEIPYSPYSFSRATAMSMEYKNSEIRGFDAGTAYSHIKTEQEPVVITAGGISTTPGNETGGQTGNPPGGSTPETTTPVTTGPETTGPVSPPPGGPTMP